MKRLFPWFLGALCALVAFSVLVSSGSRGCGEDPVTFKAQQEMRELSKALMVYADDHEGRLPASLYDLRPEYVGNGELLEDVLLATPGASLDLLPPKTIVTFRVIPVSSWRARSEVIVMYPDGQTVRETFRIRRR